MYNTIATDNKFDALTIASVNLNSLMVKKNSKDLRMSPDEADLYIDEKPIETQNDIDAIAKKVLYDTLYRFVKEVVVPNTDSLKKIDYLINDMPVKSNPDKPKWSMYASFIPDQVLIGTLLAIYHARPDKQQLFDKYLAYGSKFEEGQNIGIDIMRKAIDQYKHLPANAEYVYLSEETGSKGLLDKLTGIFKKK